MSIHQKTRVRPVNQEDLEKKQEILLLHNETELFRRIIEDVYPSGIVSIVSDTWDFWGVLRNILPNLKDKIMSRNGKVVIRPDSGDPVKIVTGYMPQKVKFSSADISKKFPGGDRASFSPDIGFDSVETSDGKFFNTDGKELTQDEVKGAVQVLYETFGGTFNKKGYIELDQHIGVIYGDGITLQRAENMLCRLRHKGFASSNIVFGVGSFTYQYNTRDTFGIACKATMVTINGKLMPIFKAPKTDDGHKKSAKGFLKVDKVNGKIQLFENVSAEEENTGMLEPVFCDGLLVRNESLAEIRERLKNA